MSLHPQKAGVEVETEAETVPKPHGRGLGGATKQRRKKSELPYPIIKKEEFGLDRECIKPTCDLAQVGKRGEKAQREHTPRLLLPCHRFPVSFPSLAPSQDPTAALCRRVTLPALPDHSLLTSCHCAVGSHGCGVYWSFASTGGVR